MLETVLKEIFVKLTEPLQLISMGVIVCQFLIIKMMVQLLNRKEDVLEGLTKELLSHGSSVRESVRLLEVLVFGRRAKGGGP